MEKLEVLEELKRKMYISVEKNDSEKEEVDKIVLDAFNKLEGIFEENRSCYPPIRRSIEDCKIDCMSITNRIIDGRTDEAKEQIDMVISKMENEIQENRVIDAQKAEREIAGISLNDRKAASQITDRLTDDLREVRAVASKVLESAGYSDRDIDKIIGEVSAYINKVENKDNDINDILFIESGSLNGDLITEFHKVKEELTQLDKEENSQTQGQKFREGLSAGKSLEEQKQYTEEIIKEQEEREQNVKKIEEQFKDALPGNIIE